ncbi:MAG: mycothiol transferase [Acidimicrobiales bacterium]|jgi:uncharacterized damage-inducible protein DinB
MRTDELLIGAFDNIRTAVHRTVDGAEPDLLTYRPDGDANSIAWLIWHLTRVQDDHVSEVAGVEQAWTSKGWFERFGLPFDPAETGYGADTSDVATVKVASYELLAGYYDATHAQTVTFLRGLSDADLDRVVDESWDPPVTLGVRLTSVITDDLEHAGQAAYVRGLAERR